MLSLSEKDRRYNLIRKNMEEMGLSAIIIISNAQVNQQGFVRYLSNVSIPIYSHTLLLPLTKEPFLFTPSPLQTFWAKELSWVPNNRISLSKNFGKDIAEKLVELNLQNNKIGILNYKTIATGDYLSLKEICPEIVDIDITDLFEEIRSVKSNEELKFVNKSIGIAEIAQKTFYKNIKPDISEMDLVSKVEEQVLKEGGERSFYLITSDISTPYSFIPRINKINKNSPVIFSVEVSGPEGYWSQIVRTYFWETPKGPLSKLYNALLELRIHIQNILRPGNSVFNFVQELKNKINKYGFEYGIGLGHGMGLDIVEEPILKEENDMIIQNNQVVCVHPHLIDTKNSLGVWMGDMYYVGKERTENLTPLHNDII